MQKNIENKKYLWSCCLVVILLMIGCQQSIDEIPASILSKELNQKTEKKTFLNRIKELLDTDDVGDQIAEPLGYLHFEDIAYFKSEFDENVAFIPIYTDKSEHTEGIIIATENDNILKFGMIVRGSLQNLPRPTEQEIPGIAMLAQLFVVLDYRIFGIDQDNDFSDIIGAVNDYSGAVNSTISTDGTDTSSPMGFVQVEDGVICTYTNKDGDEEGVENCWSTYHWEYVPSTPVVMDWGRSGGGGSGGSSPRNTNIDPKKPCKENPIKNPEIAPQKNSGVKGGRFGPDVRKHKDGSNKKHDGLDLKNDLGDNVYSMYSGTVLNSGYQAEGWGYWTIIKSVVNGKTVMVLYAHLATQPPKTGRVSAGKILGRAGDSGNLKTAKGDGAVQHLHIEVREGPHWGSATKKNPEEYIKTKFDNNGNAIASTKC